jgi:hypothetical protein
MHIFEATGQHVAAGYFKRVIGNQFQGARFNNDTIFFFTTFLFFSASEKTVKVRAGVLGRLDYY